MMKKTVTGLVCASVLISVAGCRVETKTEQVPEAEGSGKKAINIRVEPMSREEIKTATDNAIDKTAEAATKIKSAATTAVGNLETLGNQVRSVTDTINLHRTPAESSTVTTTTRVTTTE